LLSIRSNSIWWELSKSKILERTSNINHRLVLRLPNLLIRKDKHTKQIPLRSRSALSLLKSITMTRKTSRKHNTWKTWSAKLHSSHKSLQWRTGKVQWPPDIVRSKKTS
jgi:hypothetical protein